MADTGGARASQALDQDPQKLLKTSYSLRAQLAGAGARGEVRKWQLTSGLQLREGGRVAHDATITLCRCSSSSWDSDNAYGYASCWVMSRCRRSQTRILRSSKWMAGRPSLVHQLLSLKAQTVLIRVRRPGTGSILKFARMLTSCDRSAV